MNYDLLFAILFYAVIYFLFFTFRSRFDVQGKIFILYRTKLGINLMDRIARVFPRTLHAISYASITIGFLGMLVIFFFLISGTISFFTEPNAPPVIAPLLPGIQTVPGAPTLSFMHWILAIFFIAVVHEFMHGVYARRYTIPIKSSGFAFLGPLLAAFVEPDEKIMTKKSTHNQLAILSAGPFANIIAAALTLILILFIFNPIANSMVTLDGVQITNINQHYPIARTNITPGFEITALNNQPIANSNDFLTALRRHKPNETIILTSNTTHYPVQLAADPTNPDRALLGVSIKPARITLAPLLQRYSFLYTAYAWFLRLLFWIFTINLGVGLFNLLPLGPIDGGRMFLAAMHHLFKNKNSARKIWMFATLTCLTLIFINLLPFLYTLLKFLFIPVQALISLFF